MPEIDYDSIVTFDQLVAAYDELASRLRSLVTHAHLDGRAFDDFVTEKGHRPLVQSSMAGNSFLYVSVSAERPGEFFVSPNERGKPGTAGGYTSARGALSSVLGMPVHRMATNYAWSGFKEQHGLEARRGIPKELHKQLAPAAAELKKAELARLLELLGPDWP